MQSTIKTPSAQEAEREKLRRELLRRIVANEAQRRAAGAKPQK
jgi:hypothetical protein